jgi:AmiR/NasT family two-component response regulator
MTSSGATRSGTHLLADLDIVVGISPEGGADQIVRQLQRDYAKVRRLWPLPDKVPGDVDVLVLEQSENLIDRLPWVPGEPTCALITVVAVDRPADLGRLCDCTPEAVLFVPAHAEAITGTVLLALNQFDYTKRLRDRIERLDQNLRTIRNVERAKSILVATRGLSEDAAYKFLRKQAMERRTTVNAVASAVIDSFELLG